MRENKPLTKAKNTKNDEFYTQYNDIRKEVNAYLDRNCQMLCKTHNRAKGNR